MNTLVTFKAQRNDIEPMFWFIAFMMVIFVGGFVAIVAMQAFGRGQFATYYSNVYRATGENFLPMDFALSFLRSLAFYSLLIFLDTGTAFFAFVVFPFANAEQGVSIVGLSISFVVGVTALFAPVTWFLGARIKVKLRKWFLLFASTTLFYYDLVGHIRSFQRLWLEPVAGYIPALGSLY